jgi:RNA recognition motif-containing protein
MNIFVGSLSFKTTEKELQNEFEIFGEVDSVKIILDPETLKSRGFAFVTMPNQDQATAAIAGLNGKEINGFAIKVNEARPRESRDGGPRRERSGTGYASGIRSGSVFGSGAGSAGGGYNRDRTSGLNTAKDLDIYDTKSSRSGGGSGKKGRGGGSHSPGGRSGGGRRSH